MKLHSMALHALVTPAIALGVGSVLAQDANSQGTEREQQSSQRDQDSTLPTPRAAQSDQSTQRDQSAQRARQSDSQTAQAAAARGDAHDQSRKQNLGYLDSAPANAMQASDLIGAEVTTTGDEAVGPVNNLIVDENGQVVAIVVGVGGFLGLGEKRIAIGWDDVTRSGGSDELQLRIDATREGLRSAPAFEERD